MGREKIYGEKKGQLTLTLTETAVEWLKAKREEIKATSMSDTIERLARE
jgi:hypothetical protein